MRTPDPTARWTTRQTARPLLGWFPGWFLGWFLGWIAGVLVLGVGLWQIASVASLAAVILDHLMPLTALATLAALLWLFMLVDAGNRDEDAGAERARRLANTAQDQAGQKSLAATVPGELTPTQTRLASLRASLLEAHEAHTAAQLNRLNDGHARLMKALGLAFSPTELSYHRYGSLAESICEQAIARLDAWLAITDRSSAREQIVDDLDTAATALDVAALEVAELARSTSAGGIAEAARELADLASRAPRLAGH